VNSFVLATIVMAAQHFDVVVVGKKEAHNPKGKAHNPKSITNNSD
jgi:hypothetical protein